MKIRTVKKSDTAEWLRMRTALWPEEPEDHPVEIERFFAESRDDLATFVAETSDGRLCGFLEAGTRPYAEGCRSSPVGYIEGWWVDSDHRKQGVGASLVDAAETWARGRGLTEMASDALLENGVSHVAHEALGYRETDRLICFLKKL